jgi:hypothetical protein
MGCASTRGALDDAHPIDGVGGARCDARRRSTRGETKANETPVAKTPGESARELRDGELAIKKGLLGSFIKEGEKEVTAEDYRKFQAEIAAKKAEAQRKMKEARANKKGPFGLW